MFFLPSCLSGHGNIFRLFSRFLAFCLFVPVFVFGAVGLSMSFCVQLSVLVTIVLVMLLTSIYYLPVDSLVCSACVVLFVCLSLCPVCLCLSVCLSACSYIFSFCLHVISQSTCLSIWPSDCVSVMRLFLVLFTYISQFVYQCLSEESCESRLSPCSLSVSPAGYLAGYFIYTCFAFSS